MKRRQLLGAGAAGLILGPTLFSSRAVADAAVLQKLSLPNTHAIMRHANAPGTGDPAGFDLADCETQRNLDRSGQVQAVLTGRIIRDTRIRFRAVLSSEWCRCLETARLLRLGTVTREPSLNSFFEAREREEEQTAALRKLLINQIAERTLMLVTHQVNITALLGGSVREGEVIVFSVGKDGATERLGSVHVPAEPVAEKS